MEPGKRESTSVRTNRSAPDDPDAAAALKYIARDERIKSYVQTDKLVHDALLGAALRFIGGERLDTCLQAAQKVTHSGHAVTIDFMGESTRDEQMAAEATREFFRVVDAIKDGGLDSSVSLDLSHIGLAIDPELAFEHASGLARHAAEARIEVMLSMEGSERTDAVLRMYRRLSERFDNVGITLQAYLHRTPADLDDALNRPGKIRLVKGAFEEAEDVAMPRDDKLDTAYRSLVERLLTSGHPTSVATHDPTILDHVHMFIERNGLATGAAEFEMLYGVEPGRLHAVRELGYRTRIYLPYGMEWYLYVCHRLAEHPPNVYRAIADAIEHSTSFTVAPDDA